MISKPGSLISVLANCGQRKRQKNINIPPAGLVNRGELTLSLKILALKTKLENLLSCA